jgi:hypothetical protein
MRTPANIFPRIVLVLVAFSLSTLQSQAGGFGGPAPFRNGSPLVSGTDGVYQGVATGKNATGIISWAISQGSQTSLSAANNWKFFVDGQTLGGQTAANISDSKVSGILDSGLTSASNTSSSGNGTSTIVVPGNSGAGFFNASINLNSPVAAFEGKGLLTGTPPRTDQIVIIQEARVVTVGDRVIFIPAEVTITSINIPGSTLADLKFKLRGTRLSTIAPATTVANTAPAN